MKIAVLVSGGVDSSVALAKLVEEGGHELRAYYLKIWLAEDLAYLGNCPWQEDLEYVRATCEQLKVPLEIISLQNEYWQEVVTYTIAELKSGHTPSPDILCNQRVKFGAFLNYFGKEFEKVASGHYAEIVWQDQLACLKQGADPVKDQAYFLSHLSQAQLQRCLFPIGGYRKAQVRAMATDWQLPSMQRKDSQGICFLGKIKFTDFVKHYLGEKTGEIRERASGRILGEHKGYWFYTIGQRKGLGLSGGPWFVTHKDIDKNVIYVAHEETHMQHAKNFFQIPRPHWIAKKPAVPELQVKIRHGEKSYECHWEEAGDGGLNVNLKAKDAGVAAGQFAVLYESEICLGGGVIAYH